MSSKDETANNAQLPPKGAFWNPAKPTLFEMAMLHSQFPADWDCDVWLRVNDISTSKRIADVRYAVNHRCSKGVFLVANCSDREFKITGEYSTLTIPHDGMRQYMIYQLRKLAAEVRRRARRADNNTE